VRVVAASTTRRPNGDLVLLVRTEAGPGALVFSPHLAKKLFVVTNPAPAGGFTRSQEQPVETYPAAPSPAVTAHVAPTTATPPAAEEPPAAERVLRTKDQRRELYTKLCAEIAQLNGAYGATASVLRRHNITTASFYAWRREFGLPASS
jgi:hypothetical protein